MFIDSFVQNSAHTTLFKRLTVKYVHKVGHRVSQLPVTGEIVGQKQRLEINGKLRDVEIIGVKMVVHIVHPTAVVTIVLSQKVLKQFRLQRTKWIVQTVGFRGFMDLVIHFIILTMKWQDLHPVQRSDFSYLLRIHHHQCLIMRSR